MRKTRRRTVCLVCYWLYNNKKENIYLTLPKAIQETGKRACVWEWNFAVKGERQISTSCWVFLCLLNFVLCESITKSKCFHTIAGSISFPPSWWHGGASFYQKVDQWTLKMRKARDHSCSLAGSAAAMLSASLQPNSWFQFSCGRCLVEGIKNASLFLIKKTNKQKTICLQVSSISGLWCWRVSCGPDWGCTVLHTKGENGYPSEFQCLDGSLKLYPNSSPSTHNPNKREGSGINITTICKSVKSYLFPLFPV